ncbi:hypothetical protein GW750_07710 [bacterium]|nr:hypothetical protein [bacterium]
MQVGIVLFDEHFEHVRTFCSFIKINQDIHDLKDVVQLLTGITKQDIVNAPSLQNVATEIADFFGEDVLLIGHNI